MVRQSRIGSRPERAIERPVLNRFGDVLWFELGNSLEISDGARDFQDTVMGTGTEPLLGHGAFEQALAIGGKFAESANELWRHLSVAIKFLAFGRKAR
jgi:hypothetical protein